MEFIDLKVQKDLIREKLLESVADVIDSGQYILGKKVDQLEQALANLLKLTIAYRVQMELMRCKLRLWHWGLLKAMR